MNKILFAYDIVEFDNEYVKRFIEILSINLEYEITVSLNEFWEHQNQYDFIVINWPDYLMGWKHYLMKEDIDSFIETLQIWKNANAKIIVTRHDTYPHTIYNENTTLLYDKCNELAEGIIHLGEFSFTDYMQRYSFAVKQKHEIIPHPLYKEFNLSISQKEAKERLGISPTDFYIIVPGGIRHEYEFKIATNICKQLKIKNKKLVFVRFSIFKIPRKRKIIEYLKFRLEKWIEEKIFKIFKYYNFMKTEDLSLHFAASDLVIISRKHTLNSGNVFLGSQYGKIIIGPNSGNTKEQLEFLDQLVFYEDDVTCTITDINDKIKSRQNSNFAKSVQQKIQDYSSDTVILERFNRLIQKLNFHNN